MNKKKISLLLVFALLAISLTACGGPKPEETVINYVESMKAFDLEKMVGNILINGEIPDTEEVVASMNIDDMPESYKNYLIANAGKIEYEILETKVEGDTGSSVVKFKYVDGIPVLTNVMREYMGEVMGKALAGEQLNEEMLDSILVELLEKQIKETEETFEEVELEIALKKIDKKWYIDGVTNEQLDVLMSNYIRLVTEVEAGMNGLQNGLGQENQNEVEEVPVEDTQEKVEETEKNEEVDTDKKSN